MAESYQKGSWIGHGRESGLRNQTHIRGIAVLIGEHIQKIRHFLMRGVLIQLPELKFVYVTSQTGRGKVSPNGADFLDYVPADAPDLFQHTSGDHVGRVIASQWGRNQV